MTLSSTRRLGQLVVLAATLAGWACPGWAQPGATDKAAAEALFQRGKAHLEAGDTEAACSQLEASQKLDPAVGTLLFLGDCYEQLGRSASAWATFEEAASLAARQDQPQRERIARIRAAALATKLSTLTIEVSAPATEGLLIRRGRASVPPASYGAALPVDPGSYRIEATAPGHEPWSTTVTVAEGKGAASVSVPPLTRSSPEAAVGPAAGATDSAAPAAPPPITPSAPSPAGPDAAPSSGPSPWVVSGAVIGAAGVGGLITGTVFGLLAKSSNDDSLEHCRTDTLCDSTGLELRSEAQDRATVATIGFVAGSVLLAGGAALIVVGATANEEGDDGAGQAALTVTPAAAASPLGLTLGGSF
ncbi:MAG: hypothetical protein JRI23_02325 [Deltaproteobacteria bacterium]|jgi:serine/threonine-protein kinase|nr:hypothetical protein [Deltaproteobacteria bacterium]MBW2530317.1 hypothetical protein [Deltaproteobacteria bacterium]